MTTPATTAPDIGRTLANQLLAERAIPLIAHLALLVLVVLVVGDQLPLTLLAPWVGLVLATTALRTVSWQRARRGPATPQATIRLIRATMLALGLAWGMGVALALAKVSPTEAAVLLIGLLGLLSGGLTTLVADRWTFPLYAAAMIVPVLLGLALTDQAMLNNVELGLVAGVVLLLVRLHAKAHDALIEHLRTTLQLQESEARFRRLADSNIIGMGFWDASGAVTDANDEYLRTIGYTREDLAAGAVNFRSLTPPEFAEIDTRVLERLAAGEQVPPWEKELIRKDGGRVAVMLGVTPLKDRPDHGVVFTLDITERKAAEANQQTLLRELQTALAEVKTLRGLIKICAHCKRVLTDEGSWEQFESYVRAHSGVEFSHGICPECARNWGGAGG
ncbi:MAG TPA: PAS domain S-box protein [Gemmatimonadales bacterium]|nr:PAS domain S-box protein [Gemmatimonadales bacterium]